MEAADWIALGQLVTATLGIVGVVVTLWLNGQAVTLSSRALELNVDAQKHQTDADNRAHWWERYTWAEGMRRSRDEDLQQLGWSHQLLLVTSPLATETESDVIQLIALQRLHVPYLDQRKEGD